VAPGQIQLDEVLSLVLLGGKLSDDDRVVKAQPLGDLHPVVAVEDVALFVLLDGKRKGPARDSPPGPSARHGRACAVQHGRYPCRR
jgi:hypothetical protein